MKKYFLLALFILLGNRGFSQNAAEELVARFDTINHTLDIEKQTFLYIDSLGHLPIENILQQRFIPLESFPNRRNIPRKLVLKPTYLLFTLQNTGNHDKQFYFYPGMHYRQLTLYKNMPSGKPEAVQQLHPKTGFVYIHLPAHTTVSYILGMSFARADFNRISAKLIEPPYLETFKLQLSNIRYDTKSAGFILSGVLLMMIIFTMVNYIINGREEFFYNCLYSVCMFLIVFLFSYLKNNPGWFNAFFLSYFSLFLLITGTLFYVQFTRKFLDTATKHPMLDKIFKAEIWLLSVLMLFYTCLHYFTHFFEFEYYIENAMKLIALGIGLFYIVIGLTNKDRLMNYLALGNAVQVLFSFISLLCILLDIKSTNVFNSALFYFELGVVASVFFFLLGLTYKNRAELIGKIRTKEAMKLDEEKLEFETRLAVIQAQQAERNRISADMHDDLGAGMTTIRLYSELAKNKMGNQIMPEIEKISSSADELLIKMNAIIWSMTSSNDSLGNMIAYIRSYALEYFENTGINCQIFIPERLPELAVTGEIRRNVFLVVKEALNNIVKHSGATQVTIILQKEPEGLSLLIKDNGKGIDYEKIRPFGNGMKNMKKRMDDIGVEFSILNHDGTTIRLYRNTRN